MATNITFHPGNVTYDERSSLLNQKGMTIWFTGLSAAGKSTVAVALEQHLLHLKKSAFRLDGDNIRFGLNKDPDSHLRIAKKIFVAFLKYRFFSPRRRPSLLRRSSHRTRQIVTLHASCTESTTLNCHSLKYLWIQAWKNVRNVTPKACTKRLLVAKSKVCVCNVTYLLT